MSRGVWVAAHIILEAGVEAVVEAIVIVAEGQFYYLSMKLKLKEVVSPATCYLWVFDWLQSVNAVCRLLDLLDLQLRIARSQGMVIYIYTIITFVCMEC